MLTVIGGVQTFTFIVYIRFSRRKIFLKYGDFQTNLLTETIPIFINYPQHQKDSLLQCNSKIIVLIFLKI